MGETAGIRHSASVLARAAIADGYGDTENQRTFRGAVQVGEGGSVDVATPHWAKFVRLELSDATVLPAAFVEIRDANGVTRGRYTGSAQPSPGAPIGDAATVRLALPSGAYASHAGFLLHL